MINVGYKCLIGTYRDNCNHIKIGLMWQGDRQQWRSGWPKGLFLMCVRDRWGSKEGGEYGCHVGGRRQQRTILGSWWKRFWQGQGYGGDRIPVGMTGAREVHRGEEHTVSSIVMAGGIGIMGRKQVTNR